MRFQVSYTVARELAPAGARSGPQASRLGHSDTPHALCGAAAQPSGSKLPRHGNMYFSSEQHPVGAGLLAKAAVHPTTMQAEPPLSRASSLPHEVQVNYTVARELAPAGARSGPQVSRLGHSDAPHTLCGAAAQPSGSKLPRHGKVLTRIVWCAAKRSPAIGFSYSRYRYHSVLVIALSL